MLKKPLRLFFLAGLCLLAFCLSACSIIKAPPPLNVVTLRAPASQAPLCAVPASMQLVVGLPEASGSLRSNRIALLFDEREIRYLAGTQWEAPIAILIQGQLVHSLNASACFSGVGTAGAGIVSPYALQTELQRLHLCYDGDSEIPQAEIILRLSLLDAEKGRILETKTIRFKEASKGKEPQYLFDALDTVVGQAMQEAVPWVASVLGKESAPLLP